MGSARITEILTDPVTTDLVQATPLMRIAYTGLDGARRVIPLGYLLRDGRFSFCTIPSSDKVPALQRDPRVAITIDAAQPLCRLLVRGTAEVEHVDGARRLPGSVTSGHACRAMGRLRRPGARLVRLDDPGDRHANLGRLNDFKRTAPRAVERLIAAKS